MKGVAKNGRYRIQGGFWASLREPFFMDNDPWQIFLQEVTLFCGRVFRIRRTMVRIVNCVRGMTTMTRAKVGAGILLLLFSLGTGAISSPQDSAQKPGVCSTIDSAVKGISGYNMKDQAAPSEDGEFLRRVMLDIVGYPPNLDQVKAFMADTAPNKRVVKIDELLATDDFADLWARMFAEVFFGNYHEVAMDTMPKLGKAASARIVGDFLKWFKLKLNKDTPWTEVVAQMLDARATDEG